jgi:tetratricopeptide (TPR) repeat protein
LVLLLILAGAFFLTTKQSPESVWQANLGSLEMAKAELADWPLNRWDDGSNVAALEPAAVLLKKALVADPDNRTAHYRLGLIAFLNRDFDEAVTHLEEAYRLGGFHKGIRKALAFSYVWAGRFDEALPLLAEIPEAEYEMGVYTWWWGTQGRDDLANAAQEALSELRN